MYPHERSLVKRLADKPFALLGINSDSDREQLKQTLVKQDITWRSWWDQGSVTGPIQTRWDVTQRPAIYVLDARGVIRHKDLYGEELDEAIDALIEKSQESSVESRAPEKSRAPTAEVSN
jgi:hypothetical protein